MEASPFSEGHPLLNHVVLERLFNLMKFDMNEFCNFRLVCHQWYKESLPIWRKNAVFYVYANDIDYWEPIEEENSSFYQMRKYPYCKYFLDSCNIRFRGRSGSLAIPFWEEVGPFMTHLSISKSRFFQADDLRKVIFELTPNLRYLALKENLYNENRPQCDLRRSDLSLKEHRRPHKVQSNLVEFRVEVEHFDPPESLSSLEQQLPISWMEVVVHFPKLKVLDLWRLCPDDPAGELGELVNTLTTIRREIGQEYFVGLEKLLLDNADSGTTTTLCPIFTEKVCDLQLPLKKLTFDVGFRAEETVFKRMLEAHSQTLRMVEIRRDCFSPPFPITSFQKNFEFLVHLEVTGPILPSLNFLKNVPNLEILRFQDRLSYGKSTPSYVDEDLSELRYLQSQFPDLAMQPPSKIIGNTDFLQLEGLVLHKMKKLFIGEEVCSGEKVAELAKLMPNLTCLRLGLGNDGFRMVCQTWEKPEALDIDPIQVADEGLLNTKAGRKFQLREILPLWRD